LDLHTLPARRLFRLYERKRTDAAAGTA